MAASGSRVHGCKHYSRHCRIRAPCCNEIFPCRHCHNEELASAEPYLRHDLPRHDVEYVICSNCDQEQPVMRRCLFCDTLMGKYFCGICKFYDDDISKGHFHCGDCGICRIGGENNFFHCNVCGCCISLDLVGNHVCIENSTKHDCAICFEYLFDSLKPIRVMKCGHTMHLDCFNELKELKSACPICMIPL